MQMRVNATRNADLVTDAQELVLTSLQDGSATPDCLVYRKHVLHPNNTACNVWTSPTGLNYPLLEGL